MKNYKPFLYGIILLQLSVNCFSQNATFTNIKKGTTIQNRASFPVAINIAGFDNSNGFYWVAVASIKHSESADWKKTVLLYNEVRKTNDADKKSELIERISMWKIDLFWPKFIVPNPIYQKDCYEGGHNPLEGLEPEPMILLIIKVDDSFNESIKEWFYNGGINNSFPGFPGSNLSDRMILGRCEIFFP